LASALRFRSSQTSVPQNDANFGIGALAAIRTNGMSINIRKVGVIGAGQMGNGIAHVCALAGFPVLLNDVSLDRIKSGLATVNGNMARQVSKQLISESERQGALDRIK